MSEFCEEQSPIVVDQERSLLCQRGPLTVFRSFDAELGVPVVVKRVALGQELSRLGRLRTEATLMRAVEDHPNILKCYVDRLSEASDHFELLLEPGECSLADLVRRQELTQGEIFSFLSQIAAGLAALHAQGIVHRDLKAANIILVNGVPKLADFGEALRPSSAPSEELTQVRGTAGFMAPEIIRGEGCSPASDIWSLGSLLYELVQRQHPFSCMEPQAIMFQVGARNVPCLTSQLLFDEIILACQAPKPADRPTAAQLLAYFSSAGY